MASTFTPNKTDSVDILTHQLATHPTSIVGSAIDCRTKKAATLFLFHGPMEAVANTTPGKFLVQVRPDSGEGSVLEHWITIREFLTKDGTPDSEAVSGTEAIGQTVISVASTTGFVIEDEVYFANGTLANSEWGKVTVVTTNTSLTLMDAITNAQTSSTVYNDASKFVCALDLNGIESFRVVWTHQGATGADCHIKGLAITYDSDGSA